MEPLAGGPAGRHLPGTELANGVSSAGGVPPEPRAGVPGAGVRGYPPGIEGEFRNWKEPKENKRKQKKTKENRKQKEAERKQKKRKQGVPLRRADRPAGTHTALAGERGPFEGATTPYGVAPSRTTLVDSEMKIPFFLLFFFSSFFFPRPVLAQVRQ